MARRIQPIFDSILADARLQGSSRSFVESLQTQYTRKKSLSPGQRRALAKIEDQLAAAPVMDTDKVRRLDTCAQNRLTTSGQLILSHQRPDGYGSRAFFPSKGDFGQGC